MFPVMLALYLMVSKTYYAQNYAGIIGLGLPLVLIPSKNRLARNIQILQVFFLQDLQDLALNLASLALKMKLFMQDMKYLARILQEKFAR